MCVSIMISCIYHNKHSQTEFVSMGNCTTQQDDIVQSQIQVNTDKPTDVDFGLESLVEYTMEEIEKHDNTKNKIWIVIHDLVYDVTEFLIGHPGGAMQLLDVAGTDCTQQYLASLHSNDAKNEGKKYLIGKLKSKAQPNNDNHANHEK
eukprot:349899_1